MAVIIITLGTQITLPADWNPADNSIEVIGGGGGGQRFNSGSTGGFGGSYAKISNFGTPGQSLTISVGTAGLGTSTNSGGSTGGDTWVSNTGSAPTSISQGVRAKGGRSASTNIGTVTYDGGNGTAGGGGGAAGPTGNGVSSSSGNGGAGSNGAGGAGGATTFAGQAGGAGAQWTATSNAISGTSLTVLAPGSTAGAGGGGGQGQTGTGGAGGNYGGAGGGGGVTEAGLLRNGGAGARGLIVLTYTPASSSNGNMFMMF